MLGKYLVLGYRTFNDSVEGQHHDFTKLVIAVRAPRDSKTEVGFNVKEARVGDHSYADKLKGLTFPMHAELDLEVTTKGFDCYEFKPLQAQAKAA